MHRIGMTPPAAGKTATAVAHLCATTTAEGTVDMTITMGAEAQADIGIEADPVLPIDARIKAEEAEETVTVIRLTLRPSHPLLRPTEDVVEETEGPAGIAQVAIGGALRRGSIAPNGIILSTTNKEGGTIGKENIGTEAVSSGSSYRRKKFLPKRLIGGLTS